MGGLIDRRLHRDERGGEKDSDRSVSPIVSALSSAPTSRFHGASVVDSGGDSDMKDDDSLEAPNTPLKDIKGARVDPGVSSGPDNTSEPSLIPSAETGDDGIGIGIARASVTEDRPNIDTPRRGADTSGSTGSASTRAPRGRGPSAKDIIYKLRLAEQVRRCV